MRIPHAVSTLYDAIPASYRLVRGRCRPWLGGVRRRVSGGDNDELEGVGDERSEECARGHPMG